MFCPKCGNTLPDNATFCNKCGNSLAPAKKEFHLGLSAKLTSLIFKGIAACNLLVAFILGIVFAASDDGDFLIKSFFGSFGTFMLFLFCGIILSAIVYGIGELIYYNGHKE